MRVSLPRRPVFLTGMMGSGKSTLAPRLAAAWSAPWLDLDRRIERLFGATIPELFAAGEPEFRRREAAALRSLVAEPGVSARTLVVACGGGVVIDPSLRALMAAVGVTVYLRVDVDTLVARLRAGARGDRPLLAVDDDALRRRLADLLDARASAYASAEVVVDGGGSPQDVLGRVLSEVDRGEAP
ncbi:MAG: shikimate kinase [Nannocystaceae bacterium]